MKSPMSLSSRRIYFFFFLGLFCVLIPILILYASGYRLSKNWSIVETGALSIYASDSDSDIYLDGQLVKQTNFFSHSLFVQDLQPGTYTVKVAEAGHISWKKKIDVLPTLVSEGYAFLPPSDHTVTDIPVKIKDADTGLLVANPDYAFADALFATTTASSTPVTPPTNLPVYVPQDAFVVGSLATWFQDNKVFAHWLGSSEKIPSYFCDNNVCQDAFLVYQAPDPVLKINFYPGRNDVIILGTSKSVIAIEMDKRQTQTVNILYQNIQKFDWKLDGKTLYIKTKNSYGKIDL